MMRAATLAMAVAMLAGGTAAEAAAPNCASGLKLRIAFPDEVRITAAEHIAAAPAAAAMPARSDPGAPPAAALPAYCRISGTINERIGAAGKPYAIGFQIALPDDWNGRLLFQGGGGLNGVIRPPLGTQATGDRPALARGFAVASTDGGHRSNTGFDYGFMADQQAALDFAHSSLGTATLAAKQIVAGYYKRAAHHSYMVGCSTGGREAMLASQRYPDLFDGIVSGAPAMRTGYSNIGTGYITAALNRAAAKDAAGKPVPLFPEADKALIVRAMLEDCDGLDGLRDGVIAKAGACAFRPARIKCAGAKTPACLLPAQVGALAAAFTPAKDAAGAVIYPAFPWDTGIVASGNRIPGILTTGVPSPLGPTNVATSINLDARVQALRADGVQALIDTYAWTNLSTFLDHGGKIVWYHGVSDPWFSASDTQDYYTRAAAANGQRFLDSSRLYLVPGAGHCGGGDNTFDRFDLLSAVVDWVEAGKAPASVPAHRQTPTPADRPLCPFPSYPHYRGTGDENRAESFECRT
jgi:pimeloyl-ACP methyl ester carboxylesterase